MSKNNPLLLELFKGSGSVGKVAVKVGYSVVSVDLDPIYTPDIETDILEWDYKKVDFIPDYIWASPPCNTFSPLTYPLKERDTKTAKPFSERAKIGTKILYKTLEIINYFKSNLTIFFYGLILGSIPKFFTQVTINNYYSVESLIYLFLAILISIGLMK